MNRTVEKLILPFLVGVSGIMCFVAGTRYTGLRYIGFYFLWLAVVLGVVAIMDRDKPKNV